MNPLERLESRRLLSAGSYPGQQFVVHEDLAGDQVDPVVAMDAAGNFVVAWDMYGYTAGPYEIFARRFNAAGQPLGPTFQVNTTTEGVQFAPSIAMNATGEFVIAWQHGNDEQADVYIRAFDATGAPRGADQIVNTTTDGEQIMPSVGIDASGAFVVTWSTGYFAHEIAARRFAANGSPVDSEFKVSDSGEVDLGPQIAMEPDGDFIIAWSRWRQSAIDNVAARYFTAGGDDPYGGPIVVDDTAPSVFFIIPSSDPIDIAVGPDGNFVVTWVIQPVGGPAIVRARVFESWDVGGPAFDVGEEYDLQSVSVGMDQAGDFTMVWRGTPLDASAYGTLAQKFSGAGAPIGQAVRVDVPGAGGSTPVMAMNAAGDFVTVFRSWGGITTRYDTWARKFYATDTTALQVVSSAFQFETSQKLVWRFSEDVSATLSLDDITLTNLTTGQTLPAAGSSLHYDALHDTATVTLGPGALPDGNYVATIEVSGVTDTAGNTLAPTSPLGFFVLPGDANRDRVVDITDLGILASHWQGSGKTFSQGDFNYDGTVDITDLGLLATNWQTQLESPSAASLRIRALPPLMLRPVPAQRPARRAIELVMEP